MANAFPSWWGELLPLGYSNSLIPSIFLNTFSMLQALFQVLATVMKDTEKALLSWSLNFRGREIGSEQWTNQWTDNLVSDMCREEKEKRMLWKRVPGGVGMESHLRVREGLPKEGTFQVWCTGLREKRKCLQERASPSHQLRGGECLSELDPEDWSLCFWESAWCRPAVSQQCGPKL